MLFDFIKYMLWCLRTDLFIGGGGTSRYEIEKSLRFRSSASAYLSKSYVGGTTPADTDTKIKTFHIPFKRGTLGTAQVLLSHSVSTSNYWYIGFTASDTLTIQNRTGGADDLIRTTSMVFRDTAAFYDLLVVVDTTQATASNRCRVYVNGVEVTSFSATTNPALNALSASFLTPGSGTWTANYGRSSVNGSQHFDGYMAEIHCIDGQALDPSYFGQTDAATGAWVPKKYTGTYGTNGFYLDFADGTSTTTLGYDASGNGNDWTTNNISLTAGSTYDWMEDTPTNNFPVWNRLSSPSTTSLTNASLTAVTPSSALGNAYASFYADGKYYVELNTNNLPSDTSNGFGVMYISSGNGRFYQSNGTYWNGSASVAYGAAYTSSHIIGMAVDSTAGTIEFFKDGVSQGQQSTPTGEFYVRIFGLISGGSVSFHINFGQRPFAYTPPSGFKALCTKNLPTPSIKKPSKYFNAKTRAGTGATYSVTGVEYQPDMLWLKNRSASASNVVIDAVRGDNAVLNTDLTNAETTTANTLTFTSDGYTYDATGAGSNASGNNYIDWMWKEGATSGVDIVTFTGTGVARTVAHDLGAAPKMMIVKKRSTASSAGWMVYHSSYTSAAYNQYLNTTHAQTNDATVWNSTAPTSSVFSVGTHTDVNANGATFVAYLFAEVAGFSKFGSYTGNGSTDGPFVWCGFRPRFILIKRTDAVASWFIFDAAREPENVADLYLLPNSSGAETTTEYGDLLSNGFKVRSTNASYNASGGTYIFAAFAELPFKYANAR